MGEALAEGELLLVLAERLQGVALEVFDILDASAEPNQPVGDSPRLAQLFWNAGMGHGGRMAA
jgi:hypothetical protein